MLSLPACSSSEAACTRRARFARLGSLRGHRKLIIHMLRCLRIEEVEGFRFEEYADECKDGKAECEFGGGPRWRTQTYETALQMRLAGGGTTARDVVQTLKPKMEAGLQNYRIKFVRVWVHQVVHRQVLVCCGLV